MLLVRLGPDGLVIQHPLDLGEQRRLLVIVVRLHKLVPRQRVADEIGLIDIFDVGRLLVDGVVAAEYRVV